MVVFVLRFGLVYFLPFALAQYTTSCSSSEQYDIRLYNAKTNTEEDGSVQICYSGSWYAVCDRYWDCREANVACRQLGYDKARLATTNSDEFFGSWSLIRHYYYSCSGSENSLTSCSSSSTSSYYCHAYSDEAGVRCFNISTSSCSPNGGLRLTGGNAADEGVLEYCYNGEWSPFCNFDDEEAAVACKQLGYSQYAGFMSPDEYTWDFPTNYTGSLFNYFSCSSFATESSISQCTLSTISSSSCGVACLHPKAIKCLVTNECTDGGVRLMDGSIAQEGRVEVCVDGVWGSVCGSGWTKQAAFVVCKQAGFIYSEPVIYTNSEYGIGKTPIVYYNIQCQGWEKSIAECTKTHYLHFTCSVTAGLLCPDDCANGDVRLVGGETSSEGTIEICINNLWGLITDASWDEKDAKVVCRQLNLPFDGAQPIYDSHYGKPDRAIHYSYVLCDGGESSITSCKKVVHSLAGGRQIYQEAVVAGVVCKNATPTPEPVCLPIQQDVTKSCENGELRLKDGSGLLEYCVNGVWSIICHMTHNETTVACRQLGYTTFTWGLPYDIESLSSSPDVSLISNISCVSTENELSECTVNEQKQCMKYCGTALGLNCYKPGECSEGSIRLADGIIEQEGRVEVCVNGVWGSVCDNGWDTTDAFVVCQELGYSDLKPLTFHGDHFGSSSGPLVYSDIRCEGWEKHFEECRKKSHLEIQCSHKTVAGVMCSDDCSDGDVRLVGSEGGCKGTVEVCYGNLWGLIDEDGWGILDATVVCHQLGFQETKNATTGSVFGKPNRIIHIGSVECDGSETSINQCVVKHYTLEEGKKLLPSVEVAGLVCCTFQSVVTTTESASPSGSKSSVSDTSSTMVALVVLVSLLLMMMVIMSLTGVVYCVHKYLRRRKIRHKHLPAMTVTRGREEDNEYYFHSSDEDNDNDMKQLMKADATCMDKAKSSLKEDEVDLTFKPSDEDDPIYELCGTTTN